MVDRAKPESIAAASNSLKVTVNQALDAIGSRIRTKIERAGQDVNLANGFDVLNPRPTLDEKVKARRNAARLLRSAAMDVRSLARRFTAQELELAPLGKRLDAIAKVEGDTAKEIELAGRMALAKAKSQGYRYLTRDGPFEADTIAITRFLRSLPENMYSTLVTQLEEFEHGRVDAFGGVLPHG